MQNPVAGKKSGKGYTDFMSFSQRCRLFFVPLSLLLLGLNVGAQEVQPYPVFPVSVVFDRELKEESFGLDRLFMDSLEIELDLAGLQISDSSDPAILIRIAYDVSDAMIQFNFLVKSLEEGRILYNSSSMEELNFELDRVLLGHARHIARMVQDYTDERLTAVRMANQTISDALGDNKKPSPEAITEPVLVPENVSANETMTAVILPSDERIAPFAPKLPPPAKLADFVLEADIGLFLAAGESARYFSGGYSFATLMGYRFVSHPGITVGLSAGAMYFIADGYARDAKGLIVAMGPGLRFKAEDSSRIIPGFKANLGAALFMVMPDGDETRTKVVPCIETAMTIDFILNKMRVQTLLGVKLFYEDRSILYGFAPGVGIEF